MTRRACEGGYVRGSILWALMYLLGDAPRAGGYIVLTKEGYAVEHKALRWSDSYDKRDGPRGGSFEACDGDNDWRPLVFCDLNCEMSLDKIPCGVPVTNRCDRFCNQIGQGLNLRHCLLNVAKTACNEPVTDNCNNVCGFLGQKDCDHGTDATTLGALVINSFDRVSNTSFRLAVGSLEPAPTLPRPMDNALYLDFMQHGHSVNISGEEGSVRPAAILKMEYIKEELMTREMEGTPQDFPTALSESNSETEKILPQEGIEFKPPSDASRDGGTPHAVRVTMFSEFTGGYVKVGQGHEEPTSHNTRAAVAVDILKGTLSFRAQLEASNYGWGGWSPEIRRIPWMDMHQHIRLDQPGLEAYSFMAWILRASGGRGFAVRKVLRSVGNLDLMRLNHDRPEKVEQCWAWYIDAVPAFHFGDQNYTHVDGVPAFHFEGQKDDDLHTGFKQAAGSWSDSKLHLATLVVNKSHVLMYQDLRLLHVTLWEIDNTSNVPFVDCAPSSTKNVSLEVGGSGLKIADVKFFPHALSVKEIETTLARGLSSHVVVDSLIGNAFRGSRGGWMPRQPGLHTIHGAAEARARLSDADPESTQDMLDYALLLDKKDVNRSRARVEVNKAAVGVQVTEVHYLGGENSHDTHRAVHDGFRIVEQLTGDRAAWGYRDCPFLFNAGAPQVPDFNNNMIADYKDANLVRVCLDKPTSKQQIRLPDATPDPLSSPSRPLPMGTEFERSLPHRQGNAPWTRTYSMSSKQHRWLPSLSGVVITTGNLHDLAGLPGLMSRLPSLTFSGTNEIHSKPAQRLFATMSPARLRCCRQNDTDNQNFVGMVCFNSSTYQHKWGLQNIIELVYNDTSSQNGSLLESTSLHQAVDAPWWFFEMWLHLNGSAVASRVPPDVYNYAFPNRSCYWLNKTNGYYGVCNYSDANQLVNAREDSFLSFVKRPELVPFREDLNVTLMLMGKGPKFDFQSWNSVDERRRGPWNQTRSITIAQGCEIFNMSSNFFDFFRIYYKVEGWEDIIRKLVFKMKVLYPNSTHSLSTTHASSITPAILAGLEIDSFFHQQDFLTRWKTHGDYWNMSWNFQSEARNTSEWTETVKNSTRAAFSLREMMEWRDEQRPHRQDSGAKMHLLLLMGGLRTASHNLTGYYIREHEATRESRPVYKQLLLARDISLGRAPNYIYATKEWYSNLEMWAVGPEIGSTDAWLKVYSEAEAPHEIEESWQELSESFPVGYNLNEDITFLAAETNVSQAEIALQWVNVMLGHSLYEEIELGIGRHFEGHINIGNVTDAERCFVCSCVSSESFECGGKAPRRESLKAEAGMECLVTDWEYVCFDTTNVSNATTDINFETPHANRFLQFPATTGRVISSGNLEDISSIGVQGTPVMGFSRRLKNGQQSVTHLQFGAHENAPWPPNVDVCLAMGCSPTDPNFTNTPSQLFGCFCSPGVERRDTELWKSHPSRVDLLYSTSRAPAPPVTNKLKVPSNDGVLLSTGNLEDVTQDSSSMTGLNISGDLHINGWLQFGSGQHVGSCDWTECNDESHLRTSGILVDATDLISGWQHRPFSVCSESDLGAPAGSLGSPSEWAALKSTCWDSKFGSYCFKFQQSSVEECFNTCTSQSCTMIMASRFQLVLLNLTSSLPSIKQIELESFAAPCRPDPLDANQELCLNVYRVPIAGMEATVRSKPRNYLSGGKDLFQGFEVAAQEQELTNILQRQREVIAVYKCLAVYRCLDAASSNLVLKVSNAHLPLIDSMTSDWYTDHCAELGWSFKTGITFHGKRLQCNTILQSFSPCRVDEKGPVSLVCGLKLLSFPTPGTALPTVSSLQQVYNNLTEVMKVINDNLEDIKKRDFASSEASVPYSSVPYLWQQEKVTSSGSKVNLKLRRYGFCNKINADSETTFSCGSGQRIQTIDFVSFGSASGLCGNFSIGSCSIDVLPDLKSCEGQENCNVPLPLIAKWNAALTARSTSCNDRSSPSLEIQVRCSNGPMIAEYLAVLDGVIGVLNTSSSRSDLSSRAQTFNRITTLEMRDNKEVLCTIATANPPLLQAHMCTERMVLEVDTYIYKGFEANVAVLVGNSRVKGSKTVLRLQSLADSNHIVSETQVMFPATNGILLSSGNLKDITVESGSMTSVAVEKESFLHGGITVGPMYSMNSFSKKLKEQVHESWWTGPVDDKSKLRSPAEGGAQWNWTAGGPWLTVFGNGDCRAPQSACTADNVDRSLKFNTSDGDLTRIDFEVLEGLVSQIAFPVSWGIRQGDSKPHSYSDVTGGRYTQLLCSPNDVLNSTNSTPACLSRVITTGNLAEIRNLSAVTVTVRGSSTLSGPIILGSGQSIAQLPVAYRGLPGDFGNSRPLDAYAWQSTFHDAWRASTSSGINQCKTASDPRCGGTSNFSRITPIVLEGSIKGDLIYRDVPRDRRPDSLHSSASAKYTGLSLRPLLWNSFEGYKCFLPLHVRLEGVYAVEKDPDYDADYNASSQKRIFGARQPIVQTQSFVTVSGNLTECKVKCEENHFCGIVTYQRLDGQFGCTLSLVPAATCDLQPSTNTHVHGTASPADFGVLLFPREQSTRITTDKPSTKRTLVFNGTMSGVVLTSGNTADLWGLPNLLNLFDVIPGEGKTSGDILRHVQLPSACNGMPTIMPDCVTPSIMDRCIKRHYPNWRGSGEPPDGWEKSDICKIAIPINEKNLKDAEKDGFKTWMANPQKPFIGIGFTSIGFKCRADWTTGGAVPQTRNDLQDIFYKSGFAMTNNDTCSLAGCKTCRPYNQPGSLPEYLDPVNFTRLHPEPESQMNRRITFPDATGTVITSGNVDDVIFQKMTLRNMIVDGMAYFGTTLNPNNPSKFEIDAPTVLRFKDKNFITGSFNFLAHTNWRDESAGVAYNKPADLTPKVSGSITGIVDYRVFEINVCVLGLVRNQQTSIYEECPFRGGQLSCPRLGAFCNNSGTNSSNAQCALPSNDNFKWRGSVLMADCETDGDCGNKAEILANPFLAQRCRSSLVCLTGKYSGEPCLVDSHCCPADQIMDCEHKCHGIEKYKVRPEKGGFHTNYYRNVYLEGCTESPTNAFLCTHNTDGLRTRCSNDTGSTSPTCPHGGPACCCDADKSCNDGTDAWCCRRDCSEGKGVSCTKAQPGDDTWLKVEDLVGQDKDGLKYTTFGSHNITKRNKIVLPDCSGVILTTGNLRELPSIFLNVTDGRTEVGGHSGFVNDIQLGGPSGGQVKLHGWFDGDLGLTFRTAAGCKSIVVSGSKTHPQSMGIYSLFPQTHNRKPIWKLENRSMYIFYKANEGVDEKGKDLGEGRWFVGKHIGADKLVGHKSPLLLRMKHMSFSPIDADLRMPGPKYLGEAPGTWEVWLSVASGRWQLEPEVKFECLIPKTTQDSLSISAPQHASKDRAVRHFLRTQPTSRSLPIATEEEDFVNNLQVEQHPSEGETKAEKINVSRCYSLMVTAGRAPNATCAQEHNCWQSIDTRPWSATTFGHYLADLGMIQPTLISGKIVVGVLREWSGCTLSSSWASTSAGPSLVLEMNHAAGSMVWSPTAHLDSRFGYFDSNRDNGISRDEFRKMEALVSKETIREDSLLVFSFLRARDFDFLDTDGNGKLSKHELTSAVVRLNIEWDPIISSSPIAPSFSGKWTLASEETWSTYTVHPETMSDPEMKAIFEHERVTGGTVSAAFDTECNLSLRLMTQAVEDGVFRQPKVFFEFADGRQLTPAEEPPANASRLYHQIYSGEQNRRFQTSINAKTVTFLSHDGCSDFSSAGFACKTENGILTAAAHQRFAEGSDALNQQQPHVIELWRTQMIPEGYGIDGWNTKTSCVLGMNLTSLATRQTETLTRIRYRRHAEQQGLDSALAQALRLARFQGMRRNTTKQLLVDLHVVELIPNGDDFVQVVFEGNQYADFEMIWFESSDPRACVAVAQLEFHTGPVVQKLTSDVRGNDSFFVDERLLVAHPEAGMIAKCASKGWFPSRTWSDFQELALPAENGRLLSSGSLDDISKEHGPVTSMLVQPDAHSHFFGDAVLGHPGHFSTASFASPVRGTQGLHFGRTLNRDLKGSSPASTRLHASSATSGDNLLMIPNSLGGTVMLQNAPHLTLSETISKDGQNIGEAALLGHLFVKGPVSLEPRRQNVGPEHVKKVADYRQRIQQASDQTPVGGYPQVPNTVVERLRIESELFGQFPLLFSGSSDSMALGPSQPFYTLAIDEPSGRNTLVLPDVMGTIVTAGDLPPFFDEMLAPDLLYFGDATFTPRFDSGRPGKDADVSFGSPEFPILVEMNAVLNTNAMGGLAMEGSQHDGKVTTLVAEAFARNNILTLPDTDGVVLMTGSLPDTLPLLTVLDRVDVVAGSTALGASLNGGKHITIGAGAERSSAWFHNMLSGRFPMHFSGFPAPKAVDVEEEIGAQAEDDPHKEEESDSPLSRPSLSIQVTQSSRKNVITLPAVSGTVITTGNLEAMYAPPHTPTYQIRANKVMLATSQMATFGAQASKLVRQHSMHSSEAPCLHAPGPYAKYARPPGEEEQREGSFVFLDSSHETDPRSERLPRIAANSFVVRAHGGVRLVTGIVHRSGARVPLEIGVQIPARNSGWSVLSDRDSKTNISEVDDSWMLEALVKVPVSTWRYQGSPEGAGVHGTGVTHMGPMAQDFNEALAPLNLGKSAANESIPGSEQDGSRILTSDADGALLSATRGMIRRIKSQENSVLELEEEIQRMMALVQANNDRIGRNAASIARHADMLSYLEGATRSLAAKSLYAPVAV